VLATGASRHINSAHIIVFALTIGLAGAEVFLTSLLATLEFDLALSTSSLHVLKLEAALRKRAAGALVPSGPRTKV
jgi:hypothetical protein